MSVHHRSSSIPEAEAPYRPISQDESEEIPESSALQVGEDEDGFVEYWKPAEPFELPKNVPGLWNYKSETYLYEFKKARPSPSLPPFPP